MNNNNIYKQLSDDNIDPTVAGIEKTMCIGGHIYDIFLKSGISPKCSPEDWKKVEHDIVKYIYSCLGEDEPKDDLCTFAALTTVISQALLVAAIAENKVNQSASTESTIQIDKSDIIS